VIAFDAPPGARVPRTICLCLYRGFPLSRGKQRRIRTRNFQQRSDRLGIALQEPWELGSSLSPLILTDQLLPSAS